MISTSARRQSSPSRWSMRLWVERWAIPASGGCATVRRIRHAKNACRVNQLIPRSLTEIAYGPEGRGKKARSPRFAALCCFASIIPRAVKVLESPGKLASAPFLVQFQPPDYCILSTLKPRGTVTSATAHRKFWGEEKA
jgi:hypothetical protein